MKMKAISENCYLRGGKRGLKPVYGKLFVWKEITISYLSAEVTVALMRAIFPKLIFKKARSYFKIRHTHFTPVRTEMQ